MFELSVETFLSSCITSFFMGLLPLLTLLTMCGKKSKDKNSEPAATATAPTTNVDLENNIEQKNDNAEIKTDDNITKINEDEIAESISPTIKSDATSSFKEAQLKVEPKSLIFTKSIKSFKLNLTNITENRLAIKVKCSDNKLYRVKPVYTFVNKNETIEIEVVRLEGQPKLDILAIVSKEAPEDAKEAVQLFKNLPDSNLKVINIIMNEKEED